MTFIAIDDSLISVENIISIRKEESISNYFDNDSPGKSKNYDIVINTGEDRKYIIKELEENMAKEKMDSLKKIIEAEHIIHII